MKKLSALVLALALCLSSASAFAAVTVNLNSEALDFDTEPVNVEGRILVPMRAIFEALGFEVTWDGENNTAIAVRSDRAIVVPVGESNIFVITDELSVSSVDVPAQIIEGRTLVPVRAVSEGSGCDVIWNGETQTVEIVSK